MPVLVQYLRTSFWKNHKILEFYIVFLAYSLFLPLIDIQLEGKKDSHNILCILFSITRVQCTLPSLQ